MNAPVVHLTSLAHGGDCGCKNHNKCADAWMLVESETSTCIECGEGTGHVDFAMCKVNKLQDAVDHGVAQGNEGVDTAETDAIDEMLNEFLAAAAFQSIPSRSTVDICLNSRNNLPRTVNSSLHVPRDCATLNANDETSDVSHCS